MTLCVDSKPAFLLGPACAGPAPNPSLTLSGTPGLNDAGNYTITWSATDSNVPAGTSVATTSLTIANSNTTPVLDQPSNMTVDEGAVATQQLTASDPEGDLLTFSKVGTSPFFMSVSTAGLVSLSPGFADAGNYTATVRVSDGETLDRMAGSGATTSHVYAVASIYAVTLTVDDGTCQATATTTADIDNEFGAIAFTTGGNGTVSLGSGKPFTCVQVEPLGGAFNVADVDLGSIKMVSEGTDSVSDISAAVGKTTVVDDKNGNGVNEIRSCFAKEDLRALFSLLPAGRNDVSVFLDGALTAGPSRLVRTVLDERQSAPGYHDVMIDGRTATGDRVPSGVYFVKVWTEHEGSITKSLTILK